MRVVDAVVEGLDLREFKKLYGERGRCPYHPKMMLKVILYAYMNNIYSCRRIEKAVQRDIHYIWLAAQERPDYVTINRFRNRVKKEINNIFTQVVLLLAERGFITLDVEYIDGTKIESKANKYTLVWRKTVEKNRAKLQEKIRVLLQQIDEVIAQDKAAEVESVELTPETLDSLIGELKDALAAEPEPSDKELKKQQREKKKQIKELEKHRLRTVPQSHRHAHSYTFLQLLSKPLRAPALCGRGRLRLRFRRKLPLHGRGRHGGLRKIQPFPPRTTPALQTQSFPSRQLPL